MRGPCDQIFVARVTRGGTGVGDVELEAQVFHGVANRGVELLGELEERLLGGRWPVQRRGAGGVPGRRERRPHDDRGLLDVGVGGGRRIPAAGLGSGGARFARRYARQAQEKSRGDEGSRRESHGQR